nr:hypothetical protein [Prevotella sp.]
MITKDSIEQAYCFFHQKWRIYSFSTDATQRDNIEYAIGSYADSMNVDLFLLLSDGKKDFLHDSSSFSFDLSSAVDKLEKLL